MHFQFFRSRHCRYFFTTSLILCLILSVMCKICSNTEFCPKISPSRSKVYGPGLKANFTVPVRYFFVKIVDTENHSITVDVSKLSVQVSGLRERCRVWTQILDIKDGNYIVRYRLFETCRGVQIDVTYDGKDVADSPYIIDGILMKERCYCPKPNVQWLAALECPSYYTQIQKDLSQFSDIDMRLVLQNAIKRFNQPGAYSICHYVIVSNKIYRKCYGQYVGFSMFMDEILLSLARKLQLPDTEMLVNLGDWPLEHSSSSKKPIPIFSWCGSKDTRDIVMPTYDITESTLEMMGRVMLDIFSVMGNSLPEWEEKERIAFWRGRDSRQERLDLIKLARKYPNIINASLTNFFFYRKEEAEYGPKAEYVSFFDFFKYRYQINIDGTVAAYRLPYLFAGGSLVLKQDSDYYEHFYSLLSPMVHYIPFNRNLSNLVDKIEWALLHDKQAKEIAENAQEFTFNNLLPKDILCYYVLLLNEYSKLLKNKPEVLKDMELVNQPTEKDCLCPENHLEKIKGSKDEL